MITPLGSAQVDAMPDDNIMITPLGAAQVEAMPDDKKRRKMQRDFEKRQICPTSEIFPTAADVENFYRARGQKIHAAIS